MLLGDLRDAIAKLLVPLRGGSMGPLARAARLQKRQASVQRK